MWPSTLRIKATRPLETMETNVEAICFNILKLAIFVWKLRNIKINLNIDFFNLLLENSTSDLLNMKKEC